jgi:glutamate--cysteine ligase
MSTRVTNSADDAIIESVQQLADYLASGSKPRDGWRIGTEHEKFGYKLGDFAPPTYDEPSGIRAILAGLQQYGWEPIVEAGNVIALKQGLGSVSLEPGGQVELSGAPLKSIHETCREIGQHLEQCAAIGKVLNIGFLGAGFIPHRTRESMPMMPKPRYKIMREYMPKVGSLGLDMMFRTCTVQVNLDYESEADMIEKFRIGLALQPVATALFANSPFTEGKPNGFLSYRSHIWTDTDAKRTGMLPFVFAADFNFERYVNYMLDVPMYFVVRDGRYVDLAGQSFRAFMDGKLGALPGERPSMADFKDHLSTAFPEVRLKTFLEMRGADAGPWSRTCALPALWVGLIYDADAQRQAADLIRDWTVAEMEELRRHVPRLGLRAPFRGGILQDVAKQVVAVAELGLRNRASLGASGESEVGFLAEAHQIAESGMTPADRLLEAYHGRWQGDITRIFADESY